VVKWFFTLAGIGFLMAGLFMRERSGDAAQAMALTFGLIGFFWLVPQLLILAVQKWKGQPG
jgi:hypothetical protein